jgi:lysozyme family protein
MLTLAQLTALENQHWTVATVLPNRLLEVEKVAAALIAPKAKAIYQQIAQAVWGAPDRWWFVAVVHEREASQNFALSIAQGDPWNQVSTHVPRGVGPFKSFVDAAVFTLTKLPVGGFIPAKWPDWTIGGVLTLWTLYNGTGYENYHDEPSPYDWGATSIEQIGKYVADGVFSSTTWDAQVGCAAIIRGMIELDQTIVFGT